MFVMIGVFLTALFQVGLSGFCSEIQALHEKARLSAIPTAEEEDRGVVFHSLDFIVGKSLLDLWRMSFDGSGVPHCAEDRLISYAKSCSRLFIDALFAEFKNDVVPLSPQQIQIVDSLNCKISEVTAELITAERKLEEIQSCISSAARRFGAVNKFIEKLINTDLNPFAYARIENFAGKETAVCHLAMNLRDCPEQDIDEASEALIGFLRIVAKNETALGMFDLCQNARINILDQRYGLRKTRKKVGRLVDTVNTLKERLNELSQKKMDCIRK